MLISQKATVSQEFSKMFQILHLTKNCLKVVLVLSKRSARTFKNFRDFTEPV